MSDILIDQLQETEGVYYSRSDSAGFIRRLIIVIVDSIVLCIIFVILAATLVTIFSESDNLIFITCLLTAYLYLAIMKLTKIRTLGYILTGVKIVNLRGQTPSLLNVTLRFFSLGLYFLQPLLVIDFLWIGDDENKQSIRDKLTETYVIKKNAISTGRGSIICNNYFLGGLSLICREVVRGKCQHRSG